MINIRNIVSDADKIEALGNEGISRMILYSNHKFNKSIHIKTLIDDIKQLCQNKLYILISHNYIRHWHWNKNCKSKIRRIKKNHRKR